MNVIRILLLAAALGLLLARPAAAQAQGLCVALVSDESGSMEANDPTFLRNAGAKLFISLLDYSDRVGIVRFASGPTRLTPNLVTLNSPGDKRALIDLLADAPPGGFTDMRAGLAEAAGLLRDQPCEARYVVLLSDGKPELPGGLPAGYEAETVALAQASGGPVLGIALTPGGESGLLFQTAAATGGAVVPAHTAADLVDAYLEILARLKDRTILGGGFTASPGPAPLALDLGLAQYVTRATFVVVQSPGVSADLVAPGGRPLAPDDPRVAFAYTADPRFAVYSVDAPPPGDWVFALSGGGRAQARAILRSRLRVAVEQPAAFHPLGQPLPLAASLIEEEQDGATTTLIGRAAISAFIVRPDGSQDALDALHDDGSAGDARAGDGLFTNLYVKTDLPGEYRITFTGYKGLIPATRTVRVTIAPFPQIVILSPAAARFEYRGEALPLAMRLEGGDPPALDAGTFVARVTAPDGAVLEIPLGPAGDTFTGAYTPEVDGRHMVEFLPQAATYKGVSYTLSALRDVELRLIPAIRLLQSEIDLGALEAQELARGIQVPLRIVSSSPRPEPVRFSLAGAPGLEITEAASSQAPSGESTVHLTLKGAPSAGEHSAVLEISGREGVDVPVRQVSLKFSVYQPSLAVQPARLELGSLRTDRAADGLRADLTVVSASLKDEVVTLAWQGPEGVVVEPETVTIPAGRTVDVAARLRGETLEAGAYAGTLRLAAREGVPVAPPAVAVAFRVAPPTFCERWCWPVAAAGALVSAGSAAGLSYLKSRPHPWGTLTTVRAPAGQYPPPPFNLAAARRLFRPGRVVIGSGPGAQLRLAGGQVLRTHAAIAAARRSTIEAIGKPPRPAQITQLVNVVENLGGGVVKVNNALVPADGQSLPLRPGARVVVGEYELQYRE